MGYRLNIYNKDINDEDLLNDIKTVAKKINKNYVSRNEYETNGSYSATPFLRRWGSWISVLEKAGLSTSRDPEEFLKLSKEKLVSDIQNVAKRLNKTTITTGEYKEFGKYRVQTILSRFSNWNQALQEAQLVSTGSNKNLTNEDLFLDIESVWTKLGRQPTSNDVRKGLAKYSLNTFARRFGGWRNALEAFVNYINVENENKESSEDIKEEIKTREIKLVNNSICKPVKNHKTTRDINLRLRFKVLQRDNFKCKCCGTSPAIDSTVILHVDHIKPWASGGETVIENLQTLCSKCNLGKSNLI